MQTSVKVFVLCLILCISLVTALQFGAKFISLDQIISALLSMIDVNATASMTNTIITDIRLPRLIYSVLTGIGLSLVGLLMQTVTRNALADPYVLGVSSGASTGAVFAIIMGGLPFLGQYNTPIFAALGAALSIILVLLCVGKSNSPVKLILIGMGMTGVFSALTMMIIYGAKHEAQVRSAMFWLLGSFAGIQWSDLPLTAIIITLFMLYIYTFNQDLDVLLLGNHEAAQMGLSVKQLQLSIVVISYCDRHTSIKGWCSWLYRPYHPSPCSDYRRT